MALEQLELEIVRPGEDSANGRVAPGDLFLVGLR
jgi:hypothetical protein